MSWFYPDAVWERGARLFCSMRHHLRNQPASMIYKKGTALEGSSSEEIPSERAAYWVCQDFGNRMDNILMYRRAKRSDPHHPERRQSLMDVQYILFYKTEQILRKYPCPVWRHHKWNRSMCEVFSFCPRITIYFPIGKGRFQFGSVARLGNWFMAPHLHHHLSGPMN